MTFAPKAHFRLAGPEDASFIFNSWLKSFRDGSEWAQQMPAKVYFDNHKQVVQRLMAESRVVIAANPDDSEHILGYVVFQPSTARVTVVHWIYVKQTFRRLGIGSDLMAQARLASDHDPALPVVGTHHVALWSALAPKWNLLFNPYILGVELHAAQVSKAS